MCALLIHFSNQKCVMAGSERTHGDFDVQYITPSVCSYLVAVLLRQLLRQCCCACSLNRIL
jgi:hypothetical protein